MYDITQKEIDRPEALALARAEAEGVDAAPPAEAVRRSTVVAPREKGKNEFLAAAKSTVSSRFTKLNDHTHDHPEQQHAYEGNEEVRLEQTSGPQDHLRLH